MAKENPPPSKLGQSMQPTSVKGIRRQIARKQFQGKPVPQWMFEALDAALKEQPDKAHSSKGIPRVLLNPKPRRVTYGRPLDGVRSKGKASKGKNLTGAELEARKRELNPYGG